MSGFSVPGFNIFDNIFSRDVSDLGVTSLEQTRFVQPIKKNLFKEVARGRMVMPTVGEGFNQGNSTGVPGPPTNIEARMVAGQIEVFFIPPTTVGSPIIYYTIASSPPGIRGVNIQNMDKVRLSGWAPGTQYTFKVTAINENGIGTASAASNIVTTPALNDSQKAGLVARSKRSNARTLNTPAIPFVNVLGPNLFRYIIRDPNPDLVYEVIITDSKIGAEVCRINNNSDAHRSDELYVSLPDPNRKYEFKFVARKINEDGTFGETSAPYTMPFCANAGTVVEDLGCGGKPGDSKVGYRRQKMITNDYKNFAGECITKDVYTCNSFCPDFKGPNGCYVPTPQQAERDKAAAEKAAEEKAAADRLAAQQANVRRVAEQKAADQRAAAQLLADQKAAEEKAATERIRAQLAAQEAAAKKAADDRAAEEKAKKEKEVAAAQLAAKQLADAQLAAEKKAADDKAAREEATRQAAAQKAEADKLAAQQAAAQLAAAEAAAVEKAARDKVAAQLAAAQLAATKLAAQKAAEQLAAAQLAAKELAEAQAREEAAAAARKVAEQRAAAKQAAKDKAAADLLALRLATTDVSQREKNAIEQEQQSTAVLAEVTRLHNQVAEKTSAEIAAAKKELADLVIKHKQIADILAAQLDAAQKVATQKLIERQAAERKLERLKHEQMKSALGWPYLVNRI
jgi:hypothetical protein